MLVDEGIPKMAQDFTKWHKIFHQHRSLVHSSSLSVEKIDTEIDTHFTREIAQPESPQGWHATRTNLEEKKRTRAKKNSTRFPGRCTNVSVV